MLHRIKNFHTKSGMFNTETGMFHTGLGMLYTESDMIYKNVKHRIMIYTRSGDYECFPLGQ